MESNPSSRFRVWKAEKLGLMVECSFYLSFLVLLNVRCVHYIPLLSFLATSFFFAGNKISLNQPGPLHSIATKSAISSGLSLRASTIVGYTLAYKTFLLLCMCNARSYLVKIFFRDI